ncbi:MAG: hypothetical protein JXM70_15810 [Pirellulales bacterium]|nr:hypothetical protein [Pirellulales bacterium]
MHKNRAKKGACIAVGLVVVALVVVAFFLLYDFNALPAADGESAFAGDSKELKATEIVPTLDTPIPQGKNAIWCASFLSAWKTLEDDIAKEPISLAGDPQIVRALNEAADPRPHIPAESLYVAAGWNNEGITEQIKSDLAEKFPDKAPPVFPEIALDSFVAYGYLEANAKFAIPYFQNREPLEFTDTTGKKTKLNSFGVRFEDEFAYRELRQQPGILFVDRKKNRRRPDCIVDLDRFSQPNQIILALIDPKPTLAETLASAENKIKEAKKEKIYGLGSSDVLLVPDMVWQITHRFIELEGIEFTNVKLKGQQIDHAQQDIQFCLDRSGIELKSEAKMYCESMETFYIFNRPFLLYMKKRDAEMPYFVMWVDNAELLNKWNGKSIEKDQPHE